VALSDDQRAMLRLLAQREQGYEDMAALMGVSVEELRGRVKDALAQLESEGETPPVLPEPPAEEKPAAEQPEEPKAEEPAVPAAPEPPVASEPPELSATPPAGQVPPAPPPDKPAAGKPKAGLLSSNGAKLGIAAIVGAVVIVVVILRVSGGGGSDDSSQPTTADENGVTTAPENESVGVSAVQEAEEAAEESSGKKEVTKAILQGDGEAHGIAIFGRVKQKLALQFVAEGLEQLPKGQAYAIWVAASPQKMLPLAISPVNSEGKIASQFEVPTELLGYLATEVFDEIAVTQVSISKLNTSLKEATSKKESPAYTGTEVMRGEITGPIVGAAKKLEEEEKAKGGE
jgi:hypothetical protein